MAKEGGVWLLTPGLGPRIGARSDVFAALRWHPTAHPLVVGEFIPADPTGLTYVAGVLVAGYLNDVSAMAHREHRSTDTIREGQPKPFRWAQITELVDPGGTSDELDPDCAT